MTDAQKARAWDILVARVEYLNQFAGNRSEMARFTAMVKEAGSQAGESSGDKMATLRTYLLTEVQRTSYRSVAKRLGLDHRTVWNLVHGRNGNPTMRTMERIEKAMEVKK